jgi:hypothetical protein
MKADDSGTPGEDSVTTTMLDDDTTPTDNDVVTIAGTTTKVEYKTLTELLDESFSSDGLLERSGGVYGLATAGTDYVTKTSTDIFENKTINISDQTSVTNITELNCATESDLVKSAIEFIIDGGGSTITTGIKGDIEIPFDCTIYSATLLADQDGAIKVDIWVDTYANYPPTDGDSITASAEPEITATGGTDIKAQDTTLTGWTKPLAAGSVMRFNVDTVTSYQRCLISLKVYKDI